MRRLPRLFVTAALVWAPSAIEAVGIRQLPADAVQGVLRDVAAGIPEEVRRVLPPVPEAVDIGPLLPDVPAELVVQPPVKAPPVAPRPRLPQETFPPIRIPTLHPIDLVEALTRLPKHFERGDSNADGEMNLTDALHILDYLVLGGEEPPCRQAADANDDGELGVTDVIRLLNFQFLGSAPPARPFGWCGVDSTPDRLGCRKAAACKQERAAGRNARLELVNAFLGAAAVEDAFEDVLRAEAAGLPTLQEEYVVFRFSRAGDVSTAEVERMRASLLLQDPTTLGEFIWVKYVNEFGTAVDDRGEMLIHGWYKMPDGGFSRLLLDPTEQAVGVYTIAEDGTISMAFDLDGNRTVDLLDVVFPDLTGVLVASEVRGLQMFDQLLGGDNFLCEGSTPSAATPDANLRGSLVLACPSGSSDQGTAGGPGTAGEAPGGFCAGRGRTSPGNVRLDHFADDPIPWTRAVVNWWAEEIRSGGDGERDPALAQAARAVLFTPHIGYTVYVTYQAESIVNFPTTFGGFARPRSEDRGDETSPRDEADDSESGRYQDTDGDGLADAEDTDGDGVADTSCSPCGGGESGDSGTSQPGIGPDGDPDLNERTTDLAAVLTEMCERLNGNSFIESVTDLLQTVVSTDCEDPLVNPNPTEAGDDPEATHQIGCLASVPEAGLGSIFDASAQAICPTAYPGPDGDLPQNCAGAAFGSSAGKIGVAYSAVIGFQACDPRICESFGRWFDEAERF